MPQVSIYALCEPDGATVRYVGRTKHDAGTRYTEHMDKARRYWRREDKSIPEVYQWITSLLEQDKTPIVSLLTQCSHEDAAEVESEWIVAMKQSGYDLVNTAPLSRTVSTRCPHCHQPTLLSIGGKNA